MVSSHAVANQWRNWLSSAALPLWDKAGFDRKTGLYHERLSWEGAATPLPALRLMVQARQISTYCRAQMDGFFTGAEQALETLERVERLYHRADGQPGWVFSITPEGQVADPMRDLYGHAFILFAYGWAHGLTRNPALLAKARETAEEILTLFAAPRGGFLTTVTTDGKGEVGRSQNPHMHLLEAFLAVYANSASQEGGKGDMFFLEQAAHLARLASKNFIDVQSGHLLEFFDDAFHPRHKWGDNRVEPGHQFEWSWLLDELLRLDNKSGELAEPTREKLCAQAGRLYENGVKHGLQPETGLVLDATTESGRVLERTTRIWPQTEFLRMACLKGDQAHAAQTTQALFERYLNTSLPGGWVDRRDADGSPLVDYMPASTLYHIYGAAQPATGL